MSMYCVSVYLSHCPMYLLSCVFIVLSCVFIVLQLSLTVCAFALVWPCVPLFAAQCSSNVSLTVILTIYTVTKNVRVQHKTTLKKYAKVQTLEIERQNNTTQQGFWILRGRCELQ